MWGLILYETSVCGGYSPVLAVDLQTDQCICAKGPVFLDLDRLGISNEPPRPHANRCLRGIWE